MTPLLWTLLGQALVTFWASLGCYSLRDFAYSRLEELCERRGRPERFRAILTQQGPALLVLELVSSAGTLFLAWTLALVLGWPAAPDPASIAESILRYGLAIACVWLVVELIPWTLGQVVGEAYLDRSWPVIHLLLVAFHPLLLLVRSADRVAHRVFGRGEPEEDDASVIDEEIRTVVDEGRREGVLPSDAGVMIERVMELQDEDVGAIMTPRTDMLCIHVDASLEVARRELLEAGHSRMPVIGDSTDEILGILYAKDLLKALEPRRSPGEPAPVLRDIVREPVYVPVTTRIPALLELMKKKHVQIAIVTDEYGGVSGLVTMEDILEEIVGEIEDEYDEDIIRQRMTPISETVAEVDARVHLDDLNERFDYGLPDDQEFDTIGGFVFTLAGRIPMVGETIRFRQLLFTILAADRRKVTRIRIEVSPESSTAVADGI
ncbi:MAG: hemolysin family protein [Planctomycetaceae bacterium]|nr:hemolysin family protein [Planctomycetaceae bacterium]